MSLWRLKGTGPELMQWLDGTRTFFQVEHVPQRDPTPPVIPSNKKTVSSYRFKTLATDVPHLKLCEFVCGKTPGKKRGILQTKRSLDHGSTYDKMYFAYALALLPYSFRYEPGRITTVKRFLAVTGDGSNPKRRFLLPGRWRKANSCRTKVCPISSIHFNTIAEQSRAERKRDIFGVDS